MPGSFVFLSASASLDTIQLTFSKIRKTEKLGEDKAKIRGSVCVFRFDFYFCSKFTPNLSEFSTEI
jgi:hypothetical protein